MKKVTSSDFERNATKYSGMAKDETVLITDDRDKPELVLLSYEVYAGLRKDNRQALRVSELSEADIKSIANANMSGEYDYLDEELED